MRRGEELGEGGVPRGEVSRQEEHRSVRDGVRALPLYSPSHAESTEHIENICILPTRAHVAVAYQPTDSLTQAIRIYSFRNEEEPITLKIFHEN